MGLDQSIFTNSKAVAQAIYEGSTPSSKWSYACFSPKNVADDGTFNRFDQYAKSRIAQNSGTLASGVVTTLFSPFGVDPTDRANTLLLMEAYGAPNGTHIAESVPVYGGQHLYQIGLFRKVNALHGWMSRHFHAQSPNGIPSDAQAGFHPSLLRVLRNDCQRVLDAFAKSQKKGEKIAKRAFPTSEGFYFGSEDYDEWFVQDIRELLDFVDTVLSVCDDDDILLTYNPWY